MEGLIHAASSKAAQLLQCSHQDIKMGMKHHVFEGEHKLQCLNNKVFRKIFESKRDEVTDYYM
jgi:hypothetical protein